MLILIIITSDFIRLPERAIMGYSALTNERTPVELRIKQNSWHSFTVRHMLPPFDRTRRFAVHCAK